MKRPTEDQVINSLGNLAPWLAPLPAIQLTVNAMTNYLGFLPLVAWGTGVTIEILNVSITTLIIKIYHHNNKRKYRAKENQVPVILPLILYFFYITLVTILVIVLDWGNDWRVLVAKGMLSALTIPASLTLAFRLWVYNIIEEKERKKDDRKEPENKQIILKEPEINPITWLTLPEKTRKEIANLTTKEIIKAYPDIHPRTARNWKRRAITLINGNHKEPENETTKDKNYQ